MPAPGEHHPAFEEYCECIFELAEDDVDIIQARIADRLLVSRPAVSEMIKRLEAEGLLTNDGAIVLTAAGIELAERVVRRHRLAERFLTDVLKLSWAEAHHEAGKWEHVMSDHVEQAMDRLLGSPTTCPHGNPIPGSAYVETDAQPLSGIAIGSEFTVARIPEELEFTPGLLEFLEESSIQPGSRRRHHGGVAGRHDDARDRRPSRRRRRVRERSNPRHHVIRRALVGALALARDGVRHHHRRPVDRGVGRHRSDHHPAPDQRRRVTRRPRRRPCRLDAPPRRTGDRGRHRRCDAGPDRGDLGGRHAAGASSTAPTWSSDCSSRSIWPAPRVERRRPADASKGYKIVADLLATLE